MEPGREDREHSSARLFFTRLAKLPQWNPAVKTGSTGRAAGATTRAGTPQWNPAVKTGSTLWFVQ